jgi:hypothetical protein
MQLAAPAPTTAATAPPLPPGLPTGWVENFGGLKDKPLLAERIERHRGRFFPRDHSSQRGDVARAGHPRGLAHDPATRDPRGATPFLPVAGSVADAIALATRLVAIEPGSGPAYAVGQAADGASFIASLDRTLRHDVTWSSRRENYLFPFLPGGPTFHYRSTVAAAPGIVALVAESQNGSGVDVQRF